MAGFRPTFTRVVLSYGNTPTGWTRPRLSQPHQRAGFDLLMRLDPVRQLEAVVIREDSTPNLWHVWYRFINERSYTSRLATFYAEAPALIYADRFNREQAAR